MRLKEAIGRQLARYLSRPISPPVKSATCTAERLAATIRKGDVLLLDGVSRFSVAIKYLTQSTWSHAALCVSDQRSKRGVLFLEADVVEGVRLVNISGFANQHTRICRPVALTDAERERLIDYAMSRLGHQYDLKNIVDLIRYLIRTPPVPSRWRRQLLALGSGDPTRAICSSLIAQAFQSIGYPILPEIFEQEGANDPCCQESLREVLRIRHHSLFVPRDFDISPYFEVIKPSISSDFDPHNLVWDHDSAAHGS